MYRIYELLEKQRNVEDYIRGAYIKKKDIKPIIFHEQNICTSKMIYLMWVSFSLPNNFLH